MSNSNRSKSNKSFFMPLFCRASINDTVKPAKFSETPATDPSSPKLSCIGQIKKRSTTTTTTNSNNNTNRFLACRFSASTNAKSSVYSSFSYTKLHRLFSGKNLISPAIDTASINNCSSKCITNRSNSCNSRGRRGVNTKKYYMTSSDDPVLMRVMVAEELDPPLPVVKCGRRDQETNVNLWKRRGIEMKTLQIQPIQLSMDHHNTNNNNVNRNFSLQTSAKTF
ncbi:uncharacterized protein LOC111913481 [Lactuca sativa]|uniref:uncharacterized protein LOC111913481 n=1 Tax=Lactuca sativa TaxID=4236 RepID=UPI000CBD2B2C|nr:uncharacterized protein LOC111913481 [Lactuca sativa]